MSYKINYIYGLEPLSGGASKKLKKRAHNQNTNILMEPKYTKPVSEPWFTLISLGLKTVEGRLNKGDFKLMQNGDVIKWTNNDFEPRSVLTKVVGKTSYNSFEEYLTKEDLQKCLPGIPSMKHGQSVYSKYFTKKDEDEFKVVAIKLQLIN